MYQRSVVKHETSMKCKLKKMAKDVFGQNGLRPIVIRAGEKVKK